MRDFLDLDHQFEHDPLARRSHLRDLMLRPQMFLVRPPPGGGTGPTSPFRTVTEGPAVISQGASAAAAPASSPAAGGAAGIGNLLPWLYPTADFLNLDKFGSIPLPAGGVPTTILKFTVPPGRNGKITQLGIDVSPSLDTDQLFNQSIVPAQLVFSISTDQKGYSFQDYEAFQFSPGAVSAPTPINGLMIKENQNIYVKVTNNNLAVGAQFVAARVLGYLYSKSLEPKVLGYQ